MPLKPVEQEEEEPKATHDFCHWAGMGVVADCWSPQFF